MYRLMKKIIERKNEKFQNASITKDDYKLWKENTLKKLDMFLACDRITAEQYEELTALLISSENLK